MIRTTTLTAVLSWLLLAAGFEPAGACIHRFSSINYPGALETVISDIDNAGQLVETYDAGHGFVYGEEGFASLHFSRASVVHPTATNELGQIAGYHLARTGWSWEHHAFLFDHEKIVDLHSPFSGWRSRSRQPKVYPLGINSEGTVVGMQIKPGSLKTRGFIYEDGEFRFIGPYRRGLNYIGGINDEGHVAGYSARFGAYLYDGAAFLPMPSEFPLFPMDLNISDQVVGFYFGGDKRAHGFFYDDGRLLTIDYPGAAGTFLTGINDDGRMTGWYREGGSSHGFVATPLPIPGAVWLLGAGLLGLALTSQSPLPSFRPRRLFMQK